MGGQDAEVTSTTQDKRKYFSCLWKVAIFCSLGRCQHPSRWCHLSFPLTQRQTSEKKDERRRSLPLSLSACWALQRIRLTHAVRRFECTPTAQPELCRYARPVTSPHRLPAPVRWVFQPCRPPLPPRYKLFVALLGHERHRAARSTSPTTYGYYSTYLLHRCTPALLLTRSR